MLENQEERIVKIGMTVWAGGPSGCWNRWLR